MGSPLYLLGSSTMEPVIACHSKAKDFCLRTTLNVTIARAIARVSTLRTGILNFGDQKAPMGRGGKVRRGMICVACIIRSGDDTYISLWRRTQKTSQRRQSNLYLCLDASKWYFLGTQSLKRDSASRSSAWSLHFPPFQITSNMRSSVATMIIPHIVYIQPKHLD